MAEKVKALEPRAGWQRCPMSGEDQLLAWAPDPSTNYPGAVVCIGCSFGVEIRKGSAYEAASPVTPSWWAGTVRVHEVKQVRVPEGHGPHPYESIEMRYKT